MIISPHEQGSSEWLQERLGVITASNLDCIITAGGKATTGSKADTYMKTLLAEWYVGKPVDTFEPTQWMQRGTELEPEARAYYEMLKEVDVEQVGLCFRDESKQVGASPDGLVGGNGLLEIKCPKASTMIPYMLDGGLPSTYKQQVQGQLWVTDREYCDFLAYHPEFEPFLVKVERDEKYIKSLSELTNGFIEEMLEKRSRLK